MRCRLATRRRNTIAHRQQKKVPDVQAGPDHRNCRDPSRYKTRDLRGLEGTAMLTKRPGVLMLLLLAILTFPMAEAIGAVLTLGTLRGAFLSLLTWLGFLRGTPVVVRPGWRPSMITKWLRPGKAVTAIGRGRRGGDGVQNLARKKSRKWEAGNEDAPADGLGTIGYAGEYRIARTHTTCLYRRAVSIA